MRARSIVRATKKARHNEPAWRKTRVPDSECPYCGAVLDAASSLEGATPSPGDLTVCIICASVLRFDDRLRLRRLSAAEWEEIKTEEPDVAERMQLHQRAVRTLDRRKFEP